MRNIILFCTVLFVSFLGRLAAQNKEMSANQTNISRILLTEGWKVQSSTELRAGGERLSSPDIDTKSWYSAKVPSTVMGVLTAHGLYKDLFIGKNYKEADKAIFDVSWWYRKEFHLSPEQLQQFVSMEFDGISYRANVWLNGKQILSKNEMYGSFRRFRLNLTGLLREKNVLAVEVFRAQMGEPNIGFVDWNPRPLDENMGIFREVHLVLEGQVGMHNTWVRSKVNLETLKQASLTIQTTLENYSDAPVEGMLTGKIEHVSFSIPVKLLAKEVRDVRITEKEVKKLLLDNPRLWWCEPFGKPDMYNLDLKFVVENRLSSFQKVRFGIRDFQSYWTEEGHRGIKINGKKVLIKSAGWTDDLFLRDTPETNELQVKYVKDMNLNSIRFENVWGTSRNIYDLCDEYGLIVIVGWSCQWEWEAYLGIPDNEYGCIHSEQDMDLLAHYWCDQLTWLRNHPSIAVWKSGSDKIANPELEKKYLKIMSEVDDRIYIAAAKSVESSVSGSTGMKMLGPYEYVGPNYWFVDKKYGGAYGFNTETGPGAQIPVLESIRKMIPEDKLWPLNETWDYHCTTSTTALNSMKVNTEMVDNMYGKSDNLNEYLCRSYLSNYQSTKSMFEAFRVNEKEATGIVQWMLNSAWPSFYWQLYDYEMIPVPAYYGVKRGNAPIQLIYNYENNGIYIVNETRQNLRNVYALIKAYDVNSKLLYEKKIPLSVVTDGVKQITTVDNSALNTLLFLEIRNEHETVLAQNFYALSSVKDEYDWDKSSWVGTPMKKYGDFKALTKLSDVKLNVSIVDFKDGELILDIENPTATIALMAQFLAKDGQGNVLPAVLWNDNYISLEPYAKRTLKCTLEAFNEINAVKYIEISGWNLNKFAVQIK